MVHRIKGFIVEKSCKSLLYCVANWKKTLDNVKNKKKILVFFTGLFIIKYDAITIWITMEVQYDKFKCV